jgi:hypothetical protein
MNKHSYYWNQETYKTNRHTKNAKKYIGLSIDCHHNQFLFFMMPSRVLRNYPHSRLLAPVTAAIFQYFLLRHEV